MKLQNDIERQKAELEKLLAIIELQDGLVHPDKARLLVTDVNGFLKIDEDRLDLFQQTEIPIPEWEPKIRLTAYEKIPKLYLDIETDGGIEVNGSHRMPTPQELAMYSDEQLENQNIFNPRKYSLKIIGLRNEKGNNVFIRGDEVDILQEFLKILNSKQPEMLFTYNGTKFDIPFIVAKCMQHGIKHPFFISDYESTFRTAQHFGAPTKFNAIYLKWGKKRCCIIDLYQQVLAYDFVARKLPSYGLKVVPVAMGLRKKDDRVELSYQQLLDCYEREDWDTVKSYLGDDLSDTELVANALAPAIYYQLLFVTEFQLQSLSTMGNATKWNSMLIRESGGIYDRDENTLRLRDGKLLTTSDKKRFKGGRTGGYAGFYQYVSKIDVASLYPSVMLAYGLCSDKDVKRIGLGILLFCKTVRIGFKTFKELAEKAYTGSALTYAKVNQKAVHKCLSFCIMIGYEYDRINQLRFCFDSFCEGRTELNELTDFLKTFGQGFFRNEATLKIFINAGYGFLGSTGVVFNDHVAAALVTAYARKVLEFMLDYTRSNGGVVSGCDTDSTMLTTGNFQTNKELFEGLQKALPPWIEINKEFDANWMFIPPTKRLDEYNKSYGWTTKSGKVNTNAKNLFYKTFLYEIKDEENEGGFVTKGDNVEVMYMSEDPEQVDLAYKFALTNYGAEPVNYNQYMEIANKFDFSFPNNEGKKKNYIYSVGGDIKSKGKFNKRDRCLLDKKFQIEYLEKYAADKDSAKEYYEQTRQQITDGTYPLDRLLINRKIRKGEVSLVEQGLGQVGDIVTIYVSGEKQFSANGSDAAYYAPHYLKILDNMMSELETVFIVSDNEAKKTVSMVTIHAERSTRRKND